MKISVYAICKNEESFIEDMIKSCHGVDEIVICDTGSSDRTIDIIKQYNVKLININVSPWRFDDARNIALSQTSGDICISLDADERIETGLIDDIRNQIDIKPGLLITHSFKTIWDWQKDNKNVSHHLHNRIHSRYGFRWINCVHEELVGATEIQYLNSEYSIIQKPDLSKTRSYRVLLEQAVKETPNKWKLWFFLAQEYYNIGDNNKTIECFKRSQLCDNADSIYIDNVLYQLGLLENAEIILMHNCLKQNTRENWYYYAIECRKQGKLNEERYALKQCLQHSKPIFDYRYNPDAWNDIESRLSEII